MSTKKQALMGISIFFIIIELISYSMTKSLNPFLVYQGDNVAMKIVISILLVMMGLSVLGLLYSSAIGEKRCSACGLELVRYTQARGGPVKCIFCGKWYHNQCFKEKGGTLTEGCGCQSEREGFF